MLTRRDDLHAGKRFLGIGHDLLHALGDLVKIVGQIICADQDDRNLGPKSLHIHVGQTPQDVLRLVPANAEIERMTRRVRFIPNGLADGQPVGRDRIPSMKMMSHGFS